MVGAVDAVIRREVDIIVDALMGVEAWIVVDAVDTTRNAVVFVVVAETVWRALDVIDITDVVGSAFVPIDVAISVGGPVELDAGDSVVLASN